MKGPECPPFEKREGWGNHGLGVWRHKGWASPLSENWPTGVGERYRDISTTERKPGCGEIYLGVNSFTYWGCFASIVTVSLQSSHRTLSTHRHREEQ